MLGLRSALVATAAAGVLMSGVAAAVPARVQSASSFQPGHYTIKSAAFPLDMAIGSGNRVVGSRTPAHWDVEPGANSTFTIRDTQTPTGGYLALNGAQAVVGPKPAPWSIVPAGNGGFAIKVPGQDMVLDLKGPNEDAPVEGHPAGGSDVERWGFISG